LEFKFENNQLLLYVPADIYSTDVLHKCFYWYGGNYNVEINPIQKNMFEIKLFSKTKDINFENLDELQEKIRTDLIDFKLRDVVTKETKTIRELIVAKAFAYYNLDENPITEISDPVGFNPDQL